MEKEFLYVGFYESIDDKFILKIGTTNDLKRRKAEHNRAYKKTPHYPIREDSTFEYVWSLPLSKYNTLRYEDRNKAKWRECGVGEYIRNDRFVCESKPKSVSIKIRKVYEILLE